MNIKQLFTDDEAVSPVIGVILMVAITVILAAVIGTFVLGLGDQVQNTAPQASFQFDYTENTGSSSDELTVTHDGGDSISGNQLNATVSGAVEGTGDGGDGTQDVTSGTSLIFGAGGGNSDGDAFTQSTVSAGSSETIDAADFYESGGVAAEDADLSAATVRIVWSGESGDNTATLGKWSGPDA